MSYDRYLEPPSTRSTERERTEFYRQWSHDNESTLMACGYEGFIDGTLYEEDGQGQWYGTCPQCGTGLEREIDLYSEAEDARQAAQDEAMQERYP